MANGDAAQAATIRNLKTTLEKLRGREGIRVSRLALTRRDAGPLFELPAVQRASRLRGGQAAVVVLELVRQSVAAGLRDSQQVIADAVLALELLRDGYLAAGIDHRTVDKLYSAQVGNRREALLEAWPLLHTAAQIALPPPVPSDRTLRGQLEDDVLTALATHLARAPAGALDVRGPHSEEAGITPGKVLVIGGAVMDVTLRVKSLPQQDASSEAHSCEITPGGKGLTQAVAAARLGMSVSLAAAIGDDAFGSEIIDFLVAERVDTSLIKIMPDARTPVTCVIGFDVGRNMAMNWRNESSVRLDQRDVDRLTGEIADADVLQVTFEPPAATVRYILSQIVATLDDKPITIVSAGPPYPDQHVGGQALAQIDYLVAHQYEIEPLFENLDGHELPDVSERLLDLGVGILSVPILSGCAVYSRRLGNFTVPSFPTFGQDSAGARDAFCSALGARLWQDPEGFSEKTALWATAAMSAATDDRGAPRSMPRLKQVEAILERSRFVVRAKEGAGGSGADVSSTA